MLDEVTLKMGWSAVSPRGSCLVLLRCTSWHWAMCSPGPKPQKDHYARGNTCDRNSNFLGELRAWLWRARMASSCCCATLRAPQSSIGH